jgi:ABC-type molybdate transport system permease subunit
LKKIEIKRFEPKSAFKTVLISASIPYIVFFSMMVISAALNNQIEKTLLLILPVILAPVLYGLVALLFVASYNWLAPKLGGLIIETNDD